jgi:hypothetical protein
MRIAKILGAVLSIVTLCAAESAEALWGEEEVPSKYVLVLVDGSASVRPSDLELYKQSFDAVVSQLKPGDKLELGMLNDNTLTTYSPILLESLDEKGGRLDQDRALRKLKTTCKEVFPSTPGKSQSTKILDGIALAEQRFSSDQNPKRSVRWLVLLSDMLENSEALNLEKKAPTGGEIATFIDSRRSSHRLPALSGALVYVAGASGSNSKMFDDSKLFWMEYIKAAGGKCDVGMYQRAPLNFK